MATIAGFQYAARREDGAGELAEALGRALAEATGRAHTCYMGQALNAGYFVRRGVKAVSFVLGDARPAHTAHDKDFRLREPHLGRIPSR